MPRWPAGETVNPRGEWPVGAMIAEWCQENGHSQVWLANKAGITPKYLSQIVHGQRVFSAEIAVHLSRATGMSANVLFRMQNDRLIEIALKTAKRRR